MKASYTLSDEEGLAARAGALREVQEAPSAPHRHRGQAPSSCPHVPHLLTGPTAQPPLRQTIV